MMDTKMSVFAIPVFLLGAPVFSVWEIKESKVLLPNLVSSKKTALNPYLKTMGTTFAQPTTYPQAKAKCQSYSYFMTALQGLSTQS